MTNEPATADLMDELDRLRAALAERDAQIAGLRELMNCYNLGGWTDAERLMKERNEARTALAERERELRIAAGMLSTVYPYSGRHPQEVLEAVQATAKQPPCETCDGKGTVERTWRCLT